MIEIFVAFGAGLISFLSPCVLPLIPGYISYISGSSLNELLEKKNINLIPILLFTLGFSIVFIIFGAASTFLGQVLLQNSYELRIFAGLVIVILSLHIIGIINLKFLNYEKRIQTNTNTNFYSPILIGMAFAFGWTPCIGPILGSILVLAATEDSINKGILLLISYSLGLRFPSRKRFINWFYIKLIFRSSWQVINLFSIKFIFNTHLNFFQFIQNI